MKKELGESFKPNCNINSKIKSSPKQSIKSIITYNYIDMQAKNIIIPFIWTLVLLALLLSLIITSSKEKEQLTSEEKTATTTTIINNEWTTSGSTIEN